MAKVRFRPAVPLLRVFGLLISSASIAFSSFFCLFKQRCDLDVFVSSFKFLISFRLTGFLFATSPVRFFLAFYCEDDVRFNQQIEKSALEY